LLIVLGYLAIAAAWLWGNPLGAAPDEEAHYVRAVGINQGDLLGQSVAVDQGHARFITWEWALENSRAFSVPATLAPPDFASCYANHPSMSAACTRAERALGAAARILTYVGIYPPFPYLLPAVLFKFARDPWTAMYLGRIGIAVVSLALLVIGILTLWQGRRHPLALLGLLAAASPMLVFLGVVLSPSGVEVAAALCFTAALIRLGASAPERPSALCALALGFGGFALATARPLGPLWPILAIAVFVLMTGLRRASAALTSNRTMTAAFAVLAGTFASIGWGLRTGQHAVVSIGDVTSSIGAAGKTIPEMLIEQVGWFGWVDTRLPDAFYIAWFTVVVGLIAAAIAVGTWRQRAGLLLAGASSYVVMVAIAAALMIPLGMNAQGRYTMPLTIGIPLWAGEIVYRNRAAMGALLRCALPVLVVAVVSAGQFVAWWLNARRYAVGTRGSWLFVASAEWQPPLAWWPWITLAGIGSACLLTGVLLALRPEIQAQHAGLT
jgi:hypothetical protein